MSHHHTCNVTSSYMQYHIIKHTSSISLRTADKTRYVTSSYMQYHIIKQSVPLHSRLATARRGFSFRKEGKRKKKKKKKKKKKEKKLCLCILGLEALDVLLGLCELWAEGGVDVVELLLLLFYLVC